MSVATDQARSRRVPGRRGAAYAVLLLAVAVPLAVFVVFGADASSVSLQGAGGPMVAFAAGVLSFASPCVLPLVPIYVTHLAGNEVMTDDGGSVAASRRRTFSHALAFVGGLSVVFIGLGAAAGLAGSTITSNQRSLEIGAGVVLMLFGAIVIPPRPRASFTTSMALLAGLAVAFLVLSELAAIRGDTVRVVLLAGALGVVWARLTGLLQLSVLARTFQPSPAMEGVGYARSFVVGGAFATGWTPCIGPVLGGVLTLAATSGEVLQGTYLLAAYSAGFAVPFLITGLAVSEVSGALKRIRPAMPAIEAATAVMLVAVGILLVGGRLTALNEWFAFAEFNQGL